MHVDGCHEALRRCLVVEFVIPYVHRLVEAQCVREWGHSVGENCTSLGNCSLMNR
jgi:hypothetical protein